MLVSGESLLSCLPDGSMQGIVGQWQREREGIGVSKFRLALAQVGRGGGTRGWLTRYPGPRNNGSDGGPQVPLACLYCTVQHTRDGQAGEKRICFDIPHDGGTCR